MVNGSAHSSDDSSSASISTSNRSTTLHTQHSDSTKVSLTHNETAAVKRSKLLVYLVLFVAALGVGIAAFFLSRRQEEQAFEAGFVKLAFEVDSVANANANKIFGVIHSLSTALTSYTRAQYVAWPNVTLSNFDIRASEAEGLTGAELIVFAPKVTSQDLEGWEVYAQANQGWVKEDWSYRNATIDPGPISPSVYYDKPDAVTSADLHYPLWQAGPVPYDASIINLDLYQHPVFHGIMRDALEVKHTLMSGVVDIGILLEKITPNYQDDGHPRSVIFEPVFDDFTEGSEVKGFIVAMLAWEYLLKDILPSDTSGILVEVEATCGDNFTYMLNGNQAQYLGDGHLHERKFDQYKLSFPFAETARYDGTQFDSNAVRCDFTLVVVATSSFENTFYSNGPVIFAVVVVLTFFFTAFVFAIYDWRVHRRQTKLLDTAERTNAIVSSLFPKDVKERIMADAEERARRQTINANFRSPAKNRLQGFLKSGEDDNAPRDTIFQSKPIADLFPEVTVMFADLVGFTAWSSMREPAQVFTLLETIYHEFDQIAKRRQVFKVETVGDCYVAVAGLPEPRKDHAVVMARFARDCLYKMHTMVRQLEITLGPDTADLGLRFGLHTGPVTAGVLRGERARFQLFGDTMNTTARIETTGAKNRIHISQETAELLIQSGKAHWIRAREDKVHAKGKGELNTFWLEVRGDNAKSGNSGGSSENGDTQGDAKDLEILSGHEMTNAKVMEALNEPAESNVKKIRLDDKAARLVNWNTEIISKILLDILLRREVAGYPPATEEFLCQLERASVEKEHIVLEESVDVIRLPPFISVSNAPRDRIKLEPHVVNQLHDYIQTIAAMYRDNPFHNFEHASHVTMSATKLLSRIVAPDIQVTGKDDLECDKLLHDHTYGITSSPLTQLAVVLGTLIHDVDHTGVPNSQLILEQASIAAVYKNKSVAEQNSIDVAWDLLMQDAFIDLRRTIYQTKCEFGMFRQLLVNIVLATDIMDKELSMKRKERWNVAFSESAALEGETLDQRKARKATIVIEHLIQASDVVHTMQHWHIYRKWNERLFFELYKAFRQGRAAIDPSDGWYNGEIGFFDFYIIPLAKKLQDCGVFGVSGDEYLNYAQQNRREWERKGQEIVAEMKEKALRMFP